MDSVPNRGNHIRHIRNILIPSACIAASLSGLPEYAGAEVPTSTLADQLTSPVPADGILTVDTLGLPGDYVFENVTLTNPTAPTFATLLDGDITHSDTSTVNILPGDTMQNVGGARVGPSGTVNVKNALGYVDIIADHLLTLKGDTVNSADNRPLDTRLLGDKLSAFQEVCFPVSGNDGDGANLNITITEATGPGYVTAYPGDGEIPGASTQNYDIGKTDSNASLIKIGPNDSKEICVRNMNNQEVHLIVDDRGAIDSDYFHPTESGEPERLVDTRIGFGGNRLRPNGQIVMKYGKPGDIVALNILPLNASAPGFGMIYSSGQPTPETSIVNYEPGSVIPSLGFAVVGPDGKFIYQSSEHATTDMVIDVLGTIDKDAVRNASSIRLADTREISPNVGPGLIEIPYSSVDTLMNPHVKMGEIVQTHNNIPYGPSPSQHFDIYKSRENLPYKGVIEWYFGGGYEGGDNSLSTEDDKIIRYLAGQGYAVVAVSYRLTTEKSFPDTYMAYKDAIAVSKHLHAHATELGLDLTNKIKAGTSAGADIAIMAGLGHDNPLFQPNWLTPKEKAAPARPDKIYGAAPPVNKEAWARFQVSTNHPNASMTVGSLNGLVGANRTDPPAYTQYAQLGALTQATTDDPPIFISFSRSDPIVQYATQESAIRALSLLGFVVLNDSGPVAGHAAGSGTHLEILEEFLKEVR